VAGYLVMKGLHEWMMAQLGEHKTEPNSGLGKAISYLLNHWLKLTLFLRQAGAPIDNNIVERSAAVSGLLTYPRASMKYDPRLVQCLQLCQQGRLSP
jgi:hypothetical protein